MFKFLLCCVMILVISLTSLQVSYADETNASTVSFSVPSNSVSFSTAITAISVSNVVPGDGTASSGSGTFVVKTNATNVLYDVWMTVPNANINSTLGVWLANSTLPLDVTLTGATSTTTISVNPASTGGGNNTRPTGAASAGNEVNGTNLTGTTYTVTVTEDLDNYSTYSNIPVGNYVLTMTANIGID